jgi:hypothetical protein
VSRAASLPLCLMTEAPFADSSTLRSLITKAFSLHCNHSQPMRIGNTPSAASTKHTVKCNFFAEVSAAAISLAGASPASVNHIIDSLISLQSNDLLLFSVIAVVLSSSLLVLILSFIRLQLTTNLSTIFSTSTKILYS